ncbi:bile acid:sodium symporter family protein [Thaumasiovibrio sp. DFM-14]|uniref:bile acid:sodium symporter family protein n=1 Tax=Thaumasiovibrio sp. DFM-14 TaxID=3384792 RepID=UPI0039A0ED7D
MVVAIVLAGLIPNVGRSGGVLHLDTVTGFGIAAIFFLHGIGLSPQAIKAGVSNWRLHIFVQAATFVAYPLLWVVFGPVLHIMMPSALAFGFCYLFVLPSTISSSVAMTSIAKGNVPGAIFNASLSGVIGVFITPALIQVFMGLDGVEMDLLGTVLSISRLLLLPMVAGQLLRPVLKPFLDKHKNVVNKVDKNVILLIVFNAFSDSVAQEIWNGFSYAALLVALVLSFAVLMLAAHTITWVAKRIGFSKEDEIAAVFCGTKKTLAAGVPMAKVIFGADPMLGMILLPIMFYHPMQIFYCAILANRYAARQLAETVAK